jgi:hypothetical protein
MKTQRVLLIGLSIAALSLCGCATSDVANTKKNRDDVARMKEEAQHSEKTDGSLRADYLADLALNGSGKKSNKPVFDQPRGGDSTK